MGTCGPCIAPTQECERHKALFLKLAEESKAALTGLGATLNERIRDLEQQNDDLEETNSELTEQNEALQKEKTQLAEKVETLEASLHEKREQLWDTIQDCRDEMKEKKRELREAEDRHAEYRRTEAVLREELGSLQRELREQKENFSQATIALNEKAKVSTEAHARLQQTVEQLERRLKTKDAEIASLQQLVHDQKASFSQATKSFNEKTTKATAKKARLKERVAQLEQHLVVQRKGFEEERAQLTQEVAKYRSDAQLMQKASSRQDDAQEKLNLSLDDAMPQLRSLLSAYDRLRGNQQGKAKAKAAQNKAAAGNTKLSRAGAADKEVLQRLKEQEQAFDQERAQLLEQASDAAKTQRDAIQQSLMEREGLLTCPISLELFEYPVLTGCCGKTFSSEALRHAVSQSPLCPFCRGQLVSTHANRDMTKLVELHRRERSVFGMSPASKSTATTTASSLDEYAVLSATAEGTRRNRRRTGASSARHSQHREHRRERVQARSEVPHRQSSVFNTQGNTPSGTSTSVAASNPSPATAVSSAATEDNRDAEPSGLHICRLGSDGPVAVPRNMVRSVLSAIRFPSTQSRSTASSRQRSRSSVNRSTASSRQRSRSRTTASVTASAGVAEQQIQPSSSSRRRTSSSTTASTTAASNAVPSATSNSSASSSRRRTSRSSPSPAPSAASVASELPSAASSAVQHSFISPAASASASSQPTGTSDTSTNAEDPSTSLAWRKASVRDHPPTAVATSTTARLSGSSARPTAAKFARRTAAASRRPVRISATQDDSALGRVKHESPRLTASQPAPRQSLSTLARSVTSLEDLLGSDFESISDSD